MSDALYPKASKASKSSRAPKVSKAPARPADDYEDYDEYDESEDYDRQPQYEQYDRRGRPVQGDYEDYDEYDEEEHSILTTPGRAIALGVAGVALLAVFAAIIWLLSTSNSSSAPKIVEGAQGGVPVIQGFVPTSENQAPVKGAYPPDFKWTENNQPVSLSSFRGDKPVFVNFWGTWCPPCRGEMPAMETFYQEHKNDIQIIGVSMGPRDDPAGVLNFVKQANYSWKFIHDGDYTVAQRYQIANVPSSYFIDKNGVIQAVQIGAMNQSQIESYYSQVAAVK
jgi:thiol-disulfide isomerase/thioredoxin